MNAWLTRVVVLNFMAGSLVLAQIKPGDFLVGYDGQSAVQNELSDVCLQNVDLQAFLMTIGSSLNEDSQLLSQIPVLEKSFKACQNRLEQLFVASQALRVIKQLAQSDDVMASEELRSGFVEFAKSELGFFGFSRGFVNKFIDALKWEGSGNLRRLKVKLFMRKIGKKINSHWAMFVVVVSVLSILRKFVKVWINGDGRRAELLHFVQGTIPRLFSKYILRRDENVFESE